GSLPNLLNIGSANRRVSTGYHKPGSTKRTTHPFQPSGDNKAQLPVPTVSSPVPPPCSRHKIDPVATP
ncbi:hypothetical protein CCMA1212_004556, partial [Trichoderma ghanense]